MSFDAVLGMECEVDFEHVHGTGYDKPLVVPARLYPVTCKGLAIERVKEARD